MFKGQIFDVFWTYTKLFHQWFAYILNIRPQILVNHAPQYAQAIAKAGSPLPSCVLFLDCTKEFPWRVHMVLTSINDRATMNAIECTALSIKLSVLLIGQIFCQHGPEVYLRHDLALLRGRNWEMSRKTLYRSIVGLITYTVILPISYTCGWLHLSC